MQICHVGLGAAQMPEQIVIRPPFGIAFARENFLMFLLRDAAFVLEFYLRPLLAGHDGFR